MNDAPLFCWTNKLREEANKCCGTVGMVGVVGVVGVVEGRMEGEKAKREWQGWATMYRVQTTCLLRLFRCPLLDR